MTFREVLRVLRHVRDVLAEYVATEERKRAEAKERAAEARRFAAEAAARQAEEVAAQEAAMRTSKQRLIARATATPKGRRKRGEAPRKSSSAPIRTMALPPVTDVYDRITEQQEPPSSAPPGLPPGLPPQLVEMFTQLGQLDDAMRNLFTVTDGLNAWFERIQRHRHWGPVVMGLSMGLSVLAQRVSSRMYHRNLFLAHQRQLDDHEKRVDRMRNGDWKEKVRYMLWTNGQRQEREARLAEREAPPPVALLSAGGW